LPTKYVSVGVKIDEVGCNSICNRADEVAMDKKLLAVGLKNNQNTILRKYQDNFHRFNSAKGLLKTYSRRTNSRAIYDARWHH